MTAAAVARAGSASALALAIFTSNLACDVRFDFGAAEAAASAGGGAGGAQSGSGTTPDSTSGGSSAGASGATSNGGSLSPGGATGYSCGDAGSAGVGGATGGTGGARCTLDAECRLSSLHCVAGDCRECATDAHCQARGIARCDTTRQRCVACLETQDCTPGLACDPLTRSCVQGCQGNDDACADGDDCDLARGVCIACEEAEDCAGSPLGSLCSAAGSCVQCDSEAGCPGQHCDDLSGRCVACRDSQDCATGVCDPALNACDPG